MTDSQWKIEVANPSPYQRSDYVEVDLESLGVDSNLDEKSLRLFRKNDSMLEEIPFQIDHLLGKYFPKRILTFLAEHTPSRKEDYSEVSASFLLKIATPEKSSTPKKTDLLNVDYYYDPADASKGDNEEDGFNSEWDSSRSVYGVKLRNDSLEVFFSLIPHPLHNTGIDFSGAATSVLLQKAPRGNPLNPDNMLFPFNILPPFVVPVDTRWGQLTKLVFFPTPWHVEFFYERSLQETKYKLIYANSGLMRAMITLQSEPFTISYIGKPFF